MKLNHRLIRFQIKQSESDEGTEKCYMIPTSWEVQTIEDLYKKSLEMVEKLNQYDKIRFGFRNNVIKEVHIRKSKEEKYSRDDSIDFSSKLSDINPLWMIKFVVINVKFNFHFFNSSNANEVNANKVFSYAKENLMSVGRGSSSVTETKRIQVKSSKSYMDFSNGTHDSKVDRRMEENEAIHLHPQNISSSSIRAVVSRQSNDESLQWSMKTAMESTKNIKHREETMERALKRINLKMLKRMKRGTLLTFRNHRNKMDCKLGCFLEFVTDVKDFDRCQILIFDGKEVMNNSPFH
jgi:hypothetical protein